MAGKATGERISGKKYRAIVEAAAIGDSINLISKTVGVTWRTAKAVVERESREIAERKEALLDLFLDIAQQAAETVKDQLHIATLMQANTIFGIAMDKSRCSHAIKRSLSDTRRNTSTLASTTSRLSPGIGSMKSWLHSLQQMRQGFQMLQHHHRHLECIPTASQTAAKRHCQILPKTRQGNRLIRECYSSGSSSKRF